MRPRVVESINELTRQNFIVYGYSHLFDSLKQMEIFKSLKFEFLTSFEQVLKCANYFSVYSLGKDAQKEQLNKILADGSKRAVITDSNHVSSLAKSTDGDFNYKVMEEKIISDHLSFMMEDRTNFLHKIFDRKMQQLVEGGIAKKIVNDASRIKLKKSDSGPNILTLHHVKIWFIIWLYGLLVAFLAIVVEFVFKYVEKKIIKTYF